MQKTPYLSSAVPHRIGDHGGGEETDDTGKPLQTGKVAAHRSANHRQPEMVVEQFSAGVVEEEMAEPGDFIPASYG